MPLESRVDVLIIGAGPAGVVCANALAIAGIHVRIIDKRAEKVTAGHADGISPRTTEVMQSYGLAERLIREGMQLHMCTFYNPSAEGRIECTERIPLVTEPTAKYPFVVGLQQGAIEAIFIDSMKEHGVEIERPKEPSAIEISEDVTELSSPSSYPVKVTVEHVNATDSKEKTEIIHAKYVVGSDGAHSWVRKVLGIEMEGEQSDYIWGVVDIVPETNFPDIRNIALIHSTNGSGMVIPREGDRNRFYLQLLETDIINPETGRIEKDRMDPQKLLSVVKKILHPYELADPKEIEWWTIYIIGQRVASSFSVKDRVFIAGDACHTHSPKAGQGMNASMNDTHNLAWKLVQVLRGWAHPTLLKTYEHERRKFAQDLIDFDKEFAALFSKKPRTEDNKDGISHEEFLRTVQKREGFVTNIGIHYSPSAIVDPTHQACAGSLIIGKRMLPQIFVRAADICPVEIQDLLPADVRFKLLFFVGSPTSARVVELNTLAEELDAPSSILRKYSYGRKISTAFEIVTIIAAKKKEANYLVVPAFFRPHWSKVLLDDADLRNNQGGCAYERFGIDPGKVTLVVVRPDGYVGTIVPSTCLGDLDKYFGSFLAPRGLDS